MLYRLEDCPLPARFYLPEGQEVRGAVLVLHGSEGGGMHIHDAHASFLASHGFAALAYDWCGSGYDSLPGLPDGVLDVSIERPVEAISWLKQHHLLRGKKVAVYGCSRGAELAMLLASLPADENVPRVDAAISEAGTNLIEAGYSSAWDGMLGSIVRRLFHRDARAWLWRGQYLNPGEPIPVERCTQPVLLIHGLADHMWGPNWSADQTKTLERRLRELGKDVDTLYLEGEGHILSPRGRYHARLKVLEFLNRVFNLQPTRQ